MNDESFPALSSNASKLTQPICIGSFAKTVQIETTPVVETKTMDTPMTTVFQSEVGRHMEEIVYMVFGIVWYVKTYNHVF